MKLGQTGFSTINNLNINHFPLHHSTRGRESEEVGDPPIISKHATQASHTGRIISSKGTQAYQIDKPHSH